MNNFQFLEINTRRDIHCQGVFAALSYSFLFRGAHIPFGIIIICFHRQDEIKSKTSIEYSIV